MLIPRFLLRMFSFCMYIEKLSEGPKNSNYQFEYLYTASCIRVRVVSCRVGTKMRGREIGEIFDDSMIIFTSARAVDAA